MRRIHAHLRHQWKGALALFLVLMVGIAYAEFDPIGTDGDIDACFRTRSGTLRLMKGDRCKRRERAVTWSQVGPQGPQGEAGPEGPVGSAGPKGDPGSALAFAHVNANGTLDSANSKNVSVAGSDAGLFCLNATTTPAPRNVVATLDITATGDLSDHIRASLDPVVVATNCVGLPGANTVVETTFGSGTNRPFYITFN